MNSAATINDERCGTEVRGYWVCKASPHPEAPNQHFLVRSGVSAEEAQPVEDLRTDHALSDHDVRDILRRAVFGRQPSRQDVIALANEVLHARKQAAARNAPTCGFPECAAQPATEAGMCRGHAKVTVSSSGSYVNDTNKADKGHG